MIISDAYRFVFMHVPKCAGSTVRHALEQYDERFKLLSAGLDRYEDSEYVFRPHGAEDFVDLPHLTLGQLQCYFPEEYLLTKGYRSFAVLRDPHERLMSSVSQRLRQYHGELVQDLGAADIRQHLTRILAQVAKLFSVSPQLPFDFIHFQPQSSYVEHDGETLVDHSIAITRLDELHGLLSEQIAGAGNALEPFHLQRTNTTMSYRNLPLRDLSQRFAGPVNAVRGLLPERLKAVLRPMIYSSDGNVLADFGRSEEVRNFISRHYSRDLELWDVANGGGPGREQ